jgi:mono/diheme cytochrome c family protein
LLVAFGLMFGLWELAGSAVAAPNFALVTWDDDDEDERPKGPRLAPGKGLGLALTLERGGVRDTRGSRLVALTVPAGSPPSPLLAPGPFRATWQGELSVPLRTDAVFSAEGRGAVKVEINGKAVFEASGENLTTAVGKPARLRKGANKFVVTYDSPTDGDASIRLSWVSDDFPREPIPPLDITHDLKNDALSMGDQLREGRQLVAELRCLKCHAGAVATDGPHAMPELQADAPDLTEVGARFRPGWLARWVADPRAVRPGTPMPRLIPPAADGRIPAEAADIAAYLATLGKPEAIQDQAVDAARVAAGGRIFAQLGCVGCHIPPERETPDQEPGRIWLRDVAAKWNRSSLPAFLRAPERNYAWISMPNFHLSLDESDKLAAYLFTGAKPDVEPAAAGDPVRGKRLFSTVGCVACHALPGQKRAATAPAFAAIPPVGWTRGCLGTGTKLAGVADFGLEPRRAEAVRAVAPGRLATLELDPAPEFAERQIRALRCNACHKRDGYEDAWSDHKTEVDRWLSGSAVEEKDPDGLPYPASQVIPSLSWTGEKLKPEWAAAFIAGRIAYKPRPYLKARMPAFPARAGGIALGLALGHGCPPASPPDRPVNADLLPVAKQLVKNSGLNCVSCHNIGKTPAVGVFEAPGVNFRHVRERIRPAFFARWVRSPMRVEPETKMPTFFNGEASVLPTILDGKADAQIEALWNYLLQGDEIEPPGN